MNKSFPHPTIDSNIGGCAHFLFTLASHVDRIFVDSINAKVSWLVLKAGKEFSSGYSSYGSLSFEQKTTKNPSGTFYQVKITGFYPRITPQVVAIMDSMLSQGFVVAITDNNKVTRLCGNPATPLFFSYDQKTGSSAADRNGLEFSFSGQVQHPCPELL